MTLYDISEQFMQLLEMAEDPDVDPEVLEATMEGLQGDFEDKADGYATVIASIKGDAAMLKEEIDRLTNRKRTMENNVKRMLQALENSMRLIGLQKFKTTRFSYNIQKNPASVVLDVDPSALPADYLIPQEPKVDKAKIKEDLKAGIDIGVAHLENTESLRIR